jgi:hypothetical protein
MFNPGLTAPRSFCSVAAGGVLPLSVTSWLSFTRSTISGFDAILCALDNTPDSNTTAKQGSTNLFRGSIFSDREPFSGNSRRGEAFKDGTGAVADWAVPALNEK